jgi:hypothetical protein
MIDPRNMRLRDWADSVILSVTDVWSFGKLENEDEWQDWAKAFVFANGYSQRNVPDPYQFTDWREWAQRAYPMLEATI